VFNFSYFYQISQYLDDVRLETTIFGQSESLPKLDKIIGQIECGLTKVYYDLISYSIFAYSCLLWLIIFIAVDIII